MIKRGLKLTDAIVLDSIIILIGMTVLTQFYDLLVMGTFTPAGFQTKVLDLAHYAPGIIKTGLLALLPYHTIFAPLFGCVLFISSISLILLLWRGFWAIATAMGYLLLWVVLWDYPGVWTFEYLFPVLFAFSAGIAKLNQTKFTTSVYCKMGWSKSNSILFIVLVSALLWYVSKIAYVNQVIGLKIAIATGVTFLITSLIHIVMDKRLSRHNLQNSILDQSQWVDIIILSVGAMMVMQVYADYFTGLYTVKGYAGLVKYYSTASGVLWLHPFLRWSASHTPLLLPIQIIFEIIVAFLLSVLVLRGPVLLLSAGLFGLLALSELGVSADWPPNAQNLTWEWELLLVTAVSLLIGISKLQELLNTSSWRKALLGQPLFQRISIMKQLFFAIISGVALYIIGIVTKIFGDSYCRISLYSGVAFFIFLTLLMLKDRYLQKK